MPAWSQCPCAVQLDAALDFLKRLPADASLDLAAFEAACGIGVEVSRDEIVAAVREEVERNKERLIAERYLFPIGNLQVCARAWRRGPRRS